jgi:hypothetical protein
VAAFSAKASTNRHLAKPCPADTLAPLKTVVCAKLFSVETDSFKIAKSPSTGHFDLI